MPYDPFAMLGTWDRVGRMWMAHQTAQARRPKPDSYYDDPHEHEGQHCLCWSMGGYAQATCRGTCHRVGGDQS